MLYTSGETLRLDPALAVQEASDLNGDPLATASLTTGPDPVYLSFGAVEPAAILEVLARRP